jgi:hypothetical protein
MEFLNALRITFWIDMGLSSEFENTKNPIEDDITDEPCEFEDGRQNELDLDDCNRANQDG